MALIITGGSSLEIKLNGIMAVIDRLALSQSQSAWKISFPGGGTGTTTTPTTPTLP
jgi:hypothetical protein